MCNVPCNICGDFDDCEIRKLQPVEYQIIKNHQFVLKITCTIEQAQELSFLNNDLIFVRQDPEWNQIFDNH